jgi:hypothetical protein
MHDHFCKIFAVAFLALALSFAAPSFAQNLSFPKKAVNFLTGGSTPSSIAVGDFNRDGKLDVAIANSSPKTMTVTILLGNGDGTFAPATTIFTFPTTAPVFLVAADFNGDGKLDLAVVNRADANVYVFLGDGTGHFAAPILTQALDGGSLTHSIAVGDFDGDGKLDMAVTNSSSNDHVASRNLAILIGHGDGTFTVSQRSLQGPSVSVAAADFDGDGKLDLVIADLATVYTLHGDGHGVFDAPVDISENQSPSFVAVGDFNRDGKPDLAIALANGNVGIRLGTGNLGDANKGFLPDNGTSDRRFGFASVPQTILVADFNGDGKPDVGVNFATSPAVAFRLGVGDGSLGGGDSFATQRGSFSAAVGDFDGDGRPDIVSVNTAGTTFSLLLNATMFTFSGDLADKTDFPVTADQTNFPATAPRGIVAGDFNNDGKLDLAVANSGTNNVSVFLGGDAGTFTLTGQSPFDSGSGAAAVAAADFDRDGVLDLAVANSGAGTVSIFTGSISSEHTAYTATLTTTVSVGDDPIAIAVGDFNGDGETDIAVVNHGSDNVSILLGNGDGTFAAAINTAVGSSPTGLAVSDFDRDGILDLAVTSSSGVTILLGVGNGHFTQPPGSPFAAGTNPSGVAAGDFDRDGKLDLAVANSGSDNVTILFGDGDGTFDGTSPSTVSVGTAPSAIAVGDFNRDGRLDLAVTNAGTDNNVSILLGDGTGSFDGSLFSSPFATGDNPVALVAGDFDRDGRLDVAVANQDDDSVCVSILLNTAPPPTVIAPSAGAVLNISSVTTIRWLFSGNPVPTSVNVLLSRDGGATFKAILKKTPNDGSQNWTVTGLPTAVNGAVIRVCTTAKVPVCVTGDAFTISP